MSLPWKCTLEAVILLVWLDAGLVHLMLVKRNSCVTIESNESVLEPLADAFSLSYYQ
jgi:hypothetical protein